MWGSLGSQDELALEENETETPLSKIARLKLRTPKTDRPFPRRDPRTLPQVMRPEFGPGYDMVGPGGEIAAGGPDIGYSGAAAEMLEAVSGPAPVVQPADEVSPIPGADEIDALEERERAQPQNRGQSILRRRLLTPRPRIGQRDDLHGAGRAHGQAIKDFIMKLLGRGAPMRGIVSPCCMGSLGKPTRPSCLECVEKHLGAAYVLLTETNDGYAHRLRAVGHLHEAEDESQKYPALHAAIRQARKSYQTQNTVPDWGRLESLLRSA